MPKPIYILALALWGITPLVAHDQKLCSPRRLSIEPITPGDFKTYKTGLGDFELVFPNGEGAATKSFTDGFKITNRKTGSSCEASKGITTAVFAGADGTKVLSVSYSGSMTYVEGFELADCKKFIDLTAYTPSASFSGNRLTIVPACECATEVDCSCDPGGIYELGKDCHATRLKKESDQQTKQKLGIAFSVPTHMAYPQTKRAKVISK